MTERKTILSNRQWILANRPVGVPTLDNFKLIESPIPTLTDGHILVKTLYLSVDPYQRGRMRNVRSYVRPLDINELIEGGVVGEVVESLDPTFHPGDFVFGRLGWQEYTVTTSAQVEKLDWPVNDLSMALGLLGMTGLTAYFGLFDVGQLKPGETVVISGAAGAVGNVAGQLAKLHGCRAVGIAGSDAKTQWLTEELKWDVAINYNKESHLRSALKKACPQGVDVYFDNVGGSISDAVITLINMKARILICGQIAIANREKPEMGPRNLLYLLVNRARMEGFLVHDFADHYAEARRKLYAWWKQGLLKNKETLVPGLEQAPTAFIGLFQGHNTGKQIVKVADPSPR